MTNEEKIRAIKWKIDELKNISATVKEQVTKLEEALLKVNPFELVIEKGTIFHKFDPAIEYWKFNNWVLIGSLGDPDTWEGVEPVARKKGDRDGLWGVLVDFNVLQEIL